MYRDNYKYGATQGKMYIKGTYNHPQSSDELIRAVEHQEVLNMYEIY